MPSPTVNFCETNVMSVCNAIEKEMQKFCRFYEKSSYSEHCMFFHFNQYCDNPEAQKHARNIETNKIHRFTLLEAKHDYGTYAEVVLMRSE